jgi:hypothetical protein
MAKPLVEDPLWAVIEPLLPPQTAAEAVSGAQAARPPARAHGDSLRAPDRHPLGSPALRDGLRLQAADQLDWSRALVGASSVRAHHAGKKRARRQRIDGSWGANITWSPMAAASRWRPASPKPTATT